MARYVPNAAGMALIEQKICAGLAANGQRGKAVAQPKTPVLTGFAQRSEHVVVQNGAGAVVGGDQTDGNGNAVLTYPSMGRPTVFLGSNSAANPVKFPNTPADEGYFLGLEMGIYSRKGSGMFAAAMNEMIANVVDDLRSAF